MNRRKIEQIQEDVLNGRDPICEGVTINFRRSAYIRWHSLNKRLKAIESRTRLSDYARARLDEMMADLEEFLDSKELIAKHENSQGASLFKNA